MNILTQYGQDIIGLDSELVNKIVEADTFIHTNKPSAQGGTDLTVVSTGDKYNWDHATGGTDVNVTQTASTANQDFEVLMSYTADNTTRTEGSRKSNKFKANPSTGNMTIGGRLTDVNGVQSIRRISEADYQALSSAEKNNGTIYHRYDKVGMDSLDINVKQTPNTTSMDAYPILFSASDSSGEVVGGTYKNPDFYYRTDLNRLILNNEGMISVYHTSTDNKRVDIAGHRISVSDIYGTHTIMDIEADDITLPDVQIGGNTYRHTWGGISDSLQSSISSLKQSLSVLIGQLQQQVTNLNDPLLNGCVYITFNTYPASASNKPTGNTGIIMTYGNGRFRQQVAFELAGEIYTRYSDNGSITAWTKRG